MKYLFANCYDLISIEFNEAFDTSHVLSMYYMFASCDSLEKINVSSFNTSLVGRMDGMFSSLDSLTSLDLSNFDTKNVDFIQSMFSNSKQLNYLDISSFDFTNIVGTVCVFDNIAPIGTIIVNKNFNDLSSLPENWTIIYKEIQDCIIGKGEKCKKCNDNITLKNQCQSCNEGYFLPEDENKFKCEICDLNGCIQCS